MIENMASFTCPHCHHTTSVFLSDGVEREAKKHDIPVLGSIPLNQSICRDADQGRPTVVAENRAELGQVFDKIASRILDELKI